jgi:hypothetical protein
MDNIEILKIDHSHSFSKNILNTNFLIFKHSYSIETNFHFFTQKNENTTKIFHIFVILSCSCEKKAGVIEFTTPQAVVFYK